MRRWRRVRDLEGAYQGAYHFTEFDLAGCPEKFSYGQSGMTGFVDAGFGVG